MQVGRIQILDFSHQVAHLDELGGGSSKGSAAGFLEGEAESCLNASPSFRAVRYKVTCDLEQRGVAAAQGLGREDSPHSIELP